MQIQWLRATTLVALVATTTLQAPPCRASCRR